MEKLINQEDRRCHTERRASPPVSARGAQAQSFEHLADHGQSRLLVATLLQRQEFWDFANRTRFGTKLMLPVGGYWLTTSD
jgi:UDP-N-acetyl-D-mannosaminuronic acid transferase (WecB/TagA/CpsF family)